MFLDIILLFQVDKSNVHRSLLPHDCEPSRNLEHENPIEPLDWTEP